MNMPANATDLISQRLPAGTIVDQNVTAMGQVECVVERDIDEITFHDLKGLFGLWQQFFFSGAHRPLSTAGCFTK